MTPARINTNIYVLVNNKTDLCITCIPIKNPEILSESNVNKLRCIKFHEIEYYTDPINNNIIDSEPSKTKEDHLLDSIHCNLCPRDTWVLNHLKNTIGDSTFTIFINYGSIFVLFVL
jgi:hypothetical protein